MCVQICQQISDDGKEGTPLVRVNPIPGLACRIYPLLSVELSTIGQWELFQSAINNIASWPASARAGMGLNIELHRPFIKNLSDSICGLSPISPPISARRTTQNALRWWCPDPGLIVDPFITVPRCSLQQGAFLAWRCVLCWYLSSITVFSVHN